MRICLVGSRRRGRTSAAGECPSAPPSHANGHAAVDSIPRPSALPDLGLARRCFQHDVTRSGSVTPHQLAPDSNPPSSPCHLTAHCTARRSGVGGTPWSRASWPPPPQQQRPRHLSRLQARPCLAHPPRRGAPPPLPPARPASAQLPPSLGHHRRCRILHRSPCRPRHRDSSSARELCRSGACTVAPSRRRPCAASPAAVAAAPTMMMTWRSDVGVTLIPKRPSMLALLHAPLPPLHAL